MSGKDCCGNFVGGHIEKNCPLVKAEAENAALRKQVEEARAIRENMGECVKHNAHRGVAFACPTCTEEIYALRKRVEGFALEGQAMMEDRDNALIERDSALRDLEAARAEAARLREAAKSVSRLYLEPKDTGQWDALDEALSSTPSTAEWMAGKMAEAEQNGIAKGYHMIAGSIREAMQGHSEWPRESIQAFIALADGIEAKARGEGA